MEFELRRRARKNLSIFVHRDLRVEVRAPLHISRRQIDLFVSKRSGWIKRQLQKFSSQQPRQPLVYSEGAEHKYLGQAVFLSLAAGARYRGELIDTQLRLTLSDPHKSELVEKTLLRWCRDRALTLFEERLQYWHARLQSQGVLLPPVKTLAVRKMKRSWGSCSSQGNIKLNLWLVTQSLEHIDYVIVHELCHMLEFNHSKAFYLLLEAAMPDWQSRKSALDASQYPPI